MVQPLPRKTVYAATVIAILALAGGWTLAAGTTAVQGPAQQSSVTVTAPSSFTTAVVQSTQIMTVSQALITGLTGAAGVQAGSGNGLNSTSANNAVLASCGAIFCAANYSAVDPSPAVGGLVQGDSALQVMLNVTQPAASPVGFDVQVEIIFDNFAAPLTNLYSFGTGYFDTGLTTTGNPAFFAVALYVDFGTSALNIPSVSHVVITMNQCQEATVCP